MSTTNIAKVLTVFQGIGNRDQNLAIKYMHPMKFTRHNPLVSDGIDGVKEWIRRLPRGKSPLKTVRAFQDGSYVIANTEGDILGQALVARGAAVRALVPHRWRTGGDQRSRARLPPERLEERGCLITYSTVTIPPCRPGPQSARPTVSLRR